MKLPGGTDPTKPLKPVPVPMTNEQMTDDLIERAQPTKSEEDDALDAEIKLGIKHKELDELKEGKYPLPKIARWTAIIAASGIIAKIAGCF